MSTTALLSTFPPHYSAHRTSELLAVYAAGPTRLRSALEGLPRDAATALPIPGKWSIQQIVHHLADAEIVGSARFRFALARHDGVLPGYDPDAWAERFRYQDACDAFVELSLALFEALRASNASLLTRLAHDEWHVTATHASWGQVTVRNLLELYADHSERHIAQIVKRRKLLCTPVLLASPLPTRLY